MALKTKPFLWSLLHLPCRLDMVQLARSSRTHGLFSFVCVRAIELPLRRGIWTWTTQVLFDRESPQSRMGHLERLPLFGARPLLGVPSMRQRLWDRFRALLVLQITNAIGVELLMSNLSIGP
jgi:hypothetical protein